MLKSKLLRNRKGMATIEMIPVIVVVAFLFNFSLGFFGVIQTGILNQIAARNYAFETFRHRTNLVYFHDDRGNGNFKAFNSRVHGITSDSRPASTGATAIATLRPIGFGESPNEGSQDDHESGSDGRGVFSVTEGKRNTDVSTSPVWLRPMYGICFNAKCAHD